MGLAHVLDPLQRELLVFALLAHGGHFLPADAALHRNRRLHVRVAGELQVDVEVADHGGDDVAVDHRLHDGLGAGAEHVDLGPELEQPLPDRAELLVGQVVGVLLVGMNREAGIAHVRQIPVEDADLAGELGQEERIPVAALLEAHVVRVVGDGVEAEARERAPDHPVSCLHLVHVAEFRVVVGELGDFSRIVGLDRIESRKFSDIFGVRQNIVVGSARRLVEELEHLLATDVDLEFDLDAVRVLELLYDVLLFVARPGQHPQCVCRTRAAREDGE